MTNLKKTILLIGLGMMAYNVAFAVDATSTKKTITQDITSPATKTPVTNTVKKTDQAATDKTDSIAKKPAIIKADPFSDANVQAWAKKAAIASFTYHFANVNTSIADSAKRYYTADGWKSFISALEKSGNLSAVVKQKLSVTAIVTGEANITSQKSVKGQKTWTLEIPLQVSYQSSTDLAKQKLNAIIQITQTKAGVGTNQMGITQIIGKPVAE